MRRCGNKEVAEVVARLNCRRWSLSTKSLDQFSRVASNTEAPLYEKFLPYDFALSASSHFISRDLLVKNSGNINYLLFNVI